MCDWYQIISMIAFVLGLAMGIVLGVSVTHDRAAEKGAAEYYIDGNKNFAKRFRWLSAKKVTP